MNPVRKFWKQFLIITLLFVGVVFASLMVRERMSFRSKASAPDVPPQNAAVTDVSSRSFVVSWFTSIPTTGKIYFGTDKNQISHVAGEEKEMMSTAHRVEIIGLTPETDYYFLICSGDDCAAHKLYALPLGKTDLNATSSANVQQGTNLAINARTTKEIKLGDNVLPAFGKVAFKDKPREANLYFVLKKGTELSAPFSAFIILDENGEGGFSVELSNAKRADLTDNFAINEEQDELKIMAVWISGGVVKTAETVFPVSQSMGIAEKIIFEEKATF